MQGTLADVPKDVVVCQICQRRHILCQIVNQFVQRVNDEFSLARIEALQIPVQLLVKLLIILLKGQCARREHRQDHGNEQNRRKYPDYDLSGFLISKKVHSDQSVIF